jgi:Acetyltransferases, including N-acetylases of ribosomal proteins
MGYELSIREAKLEDALAIHNIRQMRGVMETILSYPSEPFSRIENRIKGRTENDYWFVGELEGKVVGLVILSRHGNPRKKHVAQITIMVNSDYHGQGIGTRLMEHLMDLADNKLKLKRLELCVFDGNMRAVNLYKKFGFAVEGSMRCSALKNNGYSDELMMARLK